MSEHHYWLSPHHFSVMRYPKEHDPEFKNLVRVYRSSPDRVTLQIRGDKSLATATLPFDVAQQIAGALLEEIK